MSDDERLAALFRDAAHEAGAPPPGFDRADVVHASNRIGARRTAIARGALGVLIVAGLATGIVAVRGQSGGGGNATVASAPSAGREGAGSAAGSGEPPMAQDSGPLSDRVKSAPVPAQPPNAASAPSALSAPAPFTGTPLGPGSTPCADRQDPALRRYLEQALPEVVGAPAAATTTECRPGGERGVNVEVTDHGARGLLSVVYLPPGVHRAGPADPDARSAPTASGGTVSVSARAERNGGTVPFARRLDAVVAYLAPRL